MTCTIDLTQFRLLNHLVGWDDDVVEGLQGLQRSSGVQLQALRDPDVTVDDSTLSRWLPPWRLAISCDGCEWYLVTPCPPQSRLLVSSACDRCWTEPLPGAFGVLQCARAVAASPMQIAISDSAIDSIVFFTNGGRRQLGQVSFSSPGPIANANWREWLVVDEQTQVLQRLDMAGVLIGPFPAPLPDKQLGTIDRLAVDDKCQVWIALKQTDGLYTLWKAQPSDSEFQQAHLSELQQAMRPNHISMVTEEGFCFQNNEEHHDKQGCGPCFSWYGRPWSPSTTIVLPPQFVERGQLLTLAIDSGIPRCRWHRVRMDADIPSGTTVAIAVSTSEEHVPTSQAAPDQEWSGFAVGTPHWADWQNAELNSGDFLVQQPPGRYLFLRLRLAGDGFHTPSVQRIRLDFPRQTSLDQLPFVYRENPQAEDFSERFLSLFDAFLEDVDGVIERLPALFDTNGCAG